MKLRLLGKWLGLVILGVLLIFLFEEIDMPAARFLGPLCASLAFSVLGSRLKAPDDLFTFAKGVLGARIAHGLDQGFFTALSGSWHFLLGGTLWALLVTSALGMILARLKIMPGTTAIWGLSPGGASVMTLLAAENGADMRVVAVTQYSRVILVSLSLVAVSRFFAGVPAGGGSGGFFSPFSPYDLGITILSALVALYLAAKSGFPGGAIVFSMILVALVKNAAGTDVTIPPFILYPCYFVIGARIGSNFSLADLKRVFRVYHYILLAVALTILFCAFFGWIMYRFGGFDPLTVYLATSPGGLDVVTIIASGTNADLSFIAAMQTARLIAVLLLGPFIAKMCVKIVERLDARGGAGV
ncbi:MAG: AbrB family transcriptional regulator [Deltaproteobacteria bacterium]|nr:AbrB family transcriptional regulator [Deltaproteobacteria bacterium]